MVPTSAPDMVKRFLEREAPAEPPGFARSTENPRKRPRPIVR